MDRLEQTRLPRVVLADHDVDPSQRYADRFQTLVILDREIVYHFEIVRTVLQGPPPHDVHQPDCKRAQAFRNVLSRLASNIGRGRWPLTPRFALLLSALLTSFNRIKDGPFTGRFTRRPAGCDHRLIQGAAYDE